MATRTSRRSPRRQIPKRNLFWARATDLLQWTETNNASYVGLLNDFGDQYGANLFGFTVTRIRGHYTWWSSNTVEPSESYHVSVGIRKDERVDQDIADEDDEQVLKHPFSDPYSDWMYARNNLGIVGSAGDEQPSGQQVALNRVELDLRAQRKFSELNESLFLAAGTEAQLSAEGGPVNFWYDLHILLKQP